MRITAGSGRALSRSNVTLRNGTPHASSLNVLRFVPVQNASQTAHVRRIWSHVSASRVSGDDARSIFSPSIVLYTVADRKPDLDSWLNIAVCDQLEIGQMSRKIQPIQRLVSGQKSSECPGSYPHACCVVLSS